MQSVKFRSDVISLTSILLAAVALFVDTRSLFAQGSDDLPVVSATLSVDDALKMADRFNTSLSISRSEIEIANAGVEAAAAPTKLSISATTYATIGNSSNVLTTSPGVSPQNIFAVPSVPFLDQNVTAMLPISTGGTLRNRQSSASSDQAASGFSFDATRLQVHEQLVETYVNVLYQSALVDAASSRLTAEQQQVAITQDKVNTGKLALVDLLREQVELADAQKEVTDAQSNAKLALVDLKTVLGVSQSSDITLTDSIITLSATTLSFSPAPTSLEDAISYASKNRPEIIADQKRIEAAEWSLKAAQGEYAPQVYAVGMADTNANSGSSSRGDYTIGLTASLPISDGGARCADIDAAKAKLHHTVADAKSNRQIIEKQVAEAWYSVQTAQQQVASTAAGLVAATQDYSLADIRYNAGKSTTAERLDSLAALTRARAESAQATASLIIAHFRFVTSLALGS